MLGTIPGWCLVGISFLLTWISWFKFYFHLLKGRLYNVMPSNFYTIPPVHFLVTFITAESLGAFLGSGFVVEIQFLLCSQDLPVWHWILPINLWKLSQFKVLFAFSLVCFPHFINPPAFISFKHGASWIDFLFRHKAHPIPKTISRLIAYCYLKNIRRIILHHPLV